MKKLIVIGVVLGLVLLAGVGAYVYFYVLVDEVPVDPFEDPDWIKILTEESPIRFRLAGNTPIERNDYISDGNMTFKNGPGYRSIFSVGPDFKLLVTLERLGPRTPGVERKMELDTQRYEQPDVSKYEYADCAADVCVRFVLENGLSCVDYQMDESPYRDQWRPHLNDSISGKFCTKSDSLITGKTIDRVLAGVSITPRK